VKKRIFATGAALLATTFIGQTASAKTLEDILKEKGVITEQEYKEATKVKPIEYKLGKGFTFTSQDEKFQLSIGGRLQVRYTFLDKDDGSQDVSQWRIRRMKFWMRGYAYTKDLTYLLQTDLTNSSNNKFIEHAYFNYKLIDEAQLLVGQTKVPFGRQWLNSSGSLQFVDRSAVSDFFRPGYDIGLKLHGKVAKGLVNYELGGYGGKGQGVISSDNDNSFAARVTVDPFGYMSYGEADLNDSAKPLVSIGANYFYDRVGVTAVSASPSGTDTLVNNNLNIGFLNGASSSIRPVNGFNAVEKLDVNMGGFDAAVKWMGFYGIGEYFFGQAEGSTTGAEARAQGYLLQGGYCIIPKKLEVAMRYGYIDPNRTVANDLQSEVGGAVSYYFVKHDLKLQADVSNLHNQASATNRDEMQYRVQAQIIF
jgi:phosphate-selective porin OprO/OprP